MRISRFLAVLFFSAVFVAPQARAQFSPSSAFISATTVPQSQLMQPAELIRLLKARPADRPVIFQVGSRVMFAQAHIPESVFAGPGVQAAGLQLLEKQVGSISKDKLIVIYCGCCPWTHCPNIGPAYKKLRELGFTNVKVLYLANNFGDDWAAKGYPVEHGQ